MILSSTTPGSTIVIFSVCGPVRIDRVAGLADRGGSKHIHRPGLVILGGVDIYNLRRLCVKSYCVPKRASGMDAVRGNALYVNGRGPGMEKAHVIFQLRCGIQLADFQRGKRCGQNLNGVGGAAQAVNDVPLAPPRLKH